MPASPIRYRTVSMYCEPEHPQVITFHIRQYGSVRKMSPIHLAHENVGVGVNHMQHYVAFASH